MRFKPANPRPDGMSENNDCVVRALSLAFNMPYVAVHDACAAAGRRPRVTTTRADRRSRTETIGQRSRSSRRCTRRAGTL